MPVSVEISDAANETGALLVEMLQERGIYRERADATVHYGTNFVRSKHGLNQNCRADKVKRMLLMQAAGVRLVPWFKGSDIPDDIKFPLLARRVTGHGGTDIVPVFQRKEIEWRLKSGWDWFSSYVPLETEYRVWVFRGYHLDTYEKVMKRPDSYKYIGRNFRNGFDFQLTKRHEDAYGQALNAIHALGLDFGAVDMLRGEDGLIYVLEVNTAPGVIKSGAQKTLVKLVDQIESWHDGGFQPWDCCG